MDKRLNEIRKRLQLRTRRFRAGNNDPWAPERVEYRDPDVESLIIRLRRENAARSFAK